MVCKPCMEFTYLRFWDSVVDVSNQGMKACRHNGIFTTVNCDSIVEIQKKEKENEKKKRKAVSHKQTRKNTRRLIPEALLSKSFQSVSAFMRIQIKFFSFSFFSFLLLACHISPLLNWKRHILLPFLLFFCVILTNLSSKFVSNCRHSYWCTPLVRLCFLPLLLLKISNSLPNTDAE